MARKFIPILIIFILVGIFGSTQVNAEAVRGQPGDLWADTILGKAEFTEVTPNTVVGNKLFYPRSVIVDRSTTPNHLYIYDGSNSRIIGIKDITRCVSQGPNCVVDAAQGDIVLGQPDFLHAACNGDASYQNFPNENDASARTLCNSPVRQLSIVERGDASSMYISPSGDLYVNDMDNHRVLKYISPFTTDTVADDVWGQTDFSGHKCNAGAVLPDASTLCFGWSGNNNWTAGVEVDSAGNLWIADSNNNRVLRFAPGSHTANLVLGQTNFTSKSTGTGLHELHAPSAVRVNSQGWVYVSDYQNNRILRYKNPATGAAGEVFGPQINFISGLDWDPSQPGKIWAARKTMADYVMLDEATGGVVRTLGVTGNGNILNNSSGSIGIDSGGNYYVPVPGGDYGNDVVFYPANGPYTTPNKRLFNGLNMINKRDAYGIVGGSGIVIAGNQFVVQDGNQRILFWNDVPSISTHKPADGILETTDFSKVGQSDAGGGGYITAITASDNYLYVARGRHNKPLRIERYSLPLTLGELPNASYNSYPFNLLGGGQLSYTGTDVFFGITAAPDDSYLWVSHFATNRVFRLRNPLTTPVVDIVLGQTDNSGTSCNRGGAPRIGATPNSLCLPGNVAMDRLGNLYVSDHSLEIQGNMRMVIFSKDTLPTNNASVIYAPDPTFIKDNVATWQPAFDATNRMVVGYNPYYPHNPRGGWFPGVYNNPLSNNSTPDAFIADYHSMAIPITFDTANNLYIGDGNRSRVLLYNNPFQVPNSTPTPTLKPGDADSDGRVDEGDYAIWLAHFGQIIQGIANGDFNMDNRVDGVDYSIWLRNYGT